MKPSAPVTSRLCGALVSNSNRLTRVPDTTRRGRVGLSNPSGKLLPRWRERYKRLRGTVTTGTVLRIGARQAAQRRGPPSLKALSLTERRLQVIASIGTRVALGAYPVGFIIVFGWAYGKQAFDVAAAATNWTNYLNAFLLSGFALVPPAVARLCTNGLDRESDRALVRDHLALATWLLTAAAVTAIALWATIDVAFSGLAAKAGAQLALWFVLLATLALAQLPLTLWLGVVQATGRYTEALLWIAAPRLIALTAVVAAAAVGAPATLAIAIAVAIVIGGQFRLAHVGRRLLRTADRRVLDVRGRARRVLRANVSAGSIALVGTLVTIVPVTVVGHVWPADVGLAHVAVTLSNAVGAVIAAAFFPASLALAERVGNPAEFRRHCMRIARGIATGIAAAIVLTWAVFPLCATLAECNASFHVVLSLVLIGAGLRLTALGPYHGALVLGRPHLALPSAVAEAVCVVGVTLALTPVFGLHTLGVAFIAGGGLRALVALTIEAKWVSARTA